MLTSNGTGPATVMIDQVHGVDERAAYPADTPMSPAMRLVLAFVAANAFAAAAFLMLFPAGSAQFFWHVTPPISAGMVGALYLAAAVPVAYAAIGGVWEPARYLAPMVVVFAALMLLATVRHLHKFDSGPKLTYWLAVYVVALVAGVVFYYQHERGGADWAVTGVPTPQAVRAIALVAGLLAAAFAVAGSVAPDRVAALWPWALTPLTTLVFLAWVGAFAAGLLWVAYDPDRRRTRPVAYLLVGAAALLAATLVAHRGDLRPDPAGIGAFCVGVAGIGLLGAFMFLFDRRRVSGQAPLRAGEPSAPRDDDALAHYLSVSDVSEVSHG